MKRGVAATLALTSLLALPLHAESVLDAVSAEVRRVYEQSRNSVVRVITVETDGRTRVGSGFFIDESGKILTTASVAQNARRISIEWLDRQWPVEQVGLDTRANVAMFRVAEKREGDGKFPALPFGDSKGLQVGSVVIAMGSPFAMPPSPSFGVVDGLDVPAAKRLCGTSHIRADIPLNPGEGGGPLLNSKGEVVGLLVASAENAPTCYALPSHSVQRLIADFEQYGEARYGWIGMCVTECAADDPEKPKDKTCIRVQQVFSNTPAFRAGIRSNDTILTVGEVPIARLSDMLDASFAARVGDKLNVTIKRELLLTNLLVEVVQRPQPVAGVRGTPASANR